MATIPGGPHLLDDMDVEDFVHDARQLHEDEQLRSGVRPGPSIRQDKTEVMRDEGSSHFWQDSPTTS